MTMTIAFDESFDGSVWTGVRPAGSARIGRTELGPRGFLDFLEGRLGLTGLHDSDAERSASLVKNLRETDGFWSQSCADDPFSSADAILSWRDGLAMGGWRGEETCSRFDSVWSMCQDLAPGLPDRLRLVAETIPVFGTDIDAVELHGSREGLPKAWRRVLDELQAHGTRILHMEAPAQAGDTDLRCSINAGFKPVGDSSLLMFRPASPMDGAQQAAAWLAEHPSAGDVVIGTDPILEEALARFGLPLTGAQAQDRDPLLDLLALVLDLAWDPPDPHRVIELLCMPLSPIPRSIAGHLADALGSWPAVGSGSWKNALKTSLENYKYPERIPDLAVRLDRLFSHTVRTQDYPIREALERAELLSDWLVSRRAMEKENQARWDAPAAMVNRFVDLLGRSGMTTLGRSQLASVLERAQSSCVGKTLREAQAGLAGVHEPGAVAAPANRILWWNCVDSSVSSVKVLPLGFEEVKAFAAVGVEIPDPVLVAQRQRLAWKRPFRYATDKLLLVCPLVDPNGTNAAPHPVWDDVTANAGGHASSVATISRTTLAGSMARAMQPVVHETAPAALASWKLPKDFKVTRREEESPTGLGALLGCPFRWLMDHVAGLYPGRSSNLPEYTAALGSLAHHVVEQALLDSGFAGAGSGEQAAAIALRIFDADAPTMVAELFIPGSEAARESVRKVIRKSAMAIHAFLGKTKTVVTSVEEEKSMEFFGKLMKGKTDLVTGKPERIVDFKYGGLKYRREELASGAAYQLAAYSAIRGGGNATVPAAYYIMCSDVFLALDPGKFGEQWGVSGASLEETWKRCVTAYERRWKELEAGLVAAPPVRVLGYDEKKDRGSVVDDELHLPPGCRFCKYGTLCGRTLEER